MKTLTIALDSNALRPLLRQYGAQVYSQVSTGELRVYIPVLVYAEQMIYPASVIENLLEAFNAQVVPLKVEHADRLGKMWADLPDPFQGQRKNALWRRHKFDCLIASMALYEDWLLVTDDNDPPFHTPGLRTMKVEKFINQHLIGEKP